MDHWDEVRTAYQVARMGTVSGAAEILGVHHATVIRHVDALEARLGVKLFQRHARGYTATEAGQDLLQVAGATDDQFSQLLGRIRGQGQGMTGELTVTSIAVLSPLVTPVLAQFQLDHPGLIVRYLTAERLFRLEYGEAHVAIRAGTAPNEPDNVVQRLGEIRPALCASDAYIARHGRPESVEDLKNHWFIGADETDNRASFNRWLADKVPRDRVIYRTTDNFIARDAVKLGVGLGFVPRWELAGQDDLHEVLEPDPEWGAPIWLVTHVDLHRTAKVQAFLTYLKEQAAGWRT